MSTEITVVNDIVEINVQEDVIVIEAPSGAYPLPTGVYSVYGRTGNVVAQDGDYNLTQLGDVTITGPLTGQSLVYNGTSWVNNTETYTGTVTSVAMTTPTGLTVTGSPITTSGTLALALATGYSIPTTASQTNWDSAYNDKINSAAVSGFPTRTITLTQQDGGTITATWDDSEATRLVTEVYNQTGATLSKGTVVYINSGHGNLPTVTKAIATGDTTSAQTYGVIKEDITNNNNGYVVVFGSLNNIDTQAYTEGTQLYLSGTTAGAWTSTKPYAPIHLVYVGIVTRSHPTQGIVEIRIQNGYEMDELHDVSAQNPNNGDILQYVSSTSLWTKTAGTTTNIAEGTNLYYTDARSRAAFSESVTGLDYNSITGVLSTTSGYGIPTTASQATWDTAYNDKINSAAVTGTTTKTLTLNQQDGGTITASWTDDNTDAVTSVFGRTGAITAQSGDYTTTQVTEGTNLYYTSARFDNDLATKTTTNLAEGTNLYYTQARFDTAFSNKTTTDLTEGTNLYYTQTRFNTAFSAKSTSDLAEGSNLYFTTGRAQSAISGTAPISVASGVVSISQAGASTNGYLSSTDWNTFNNKQAAGNYITALTGEVTASGPNSASATISNSAVIGKVLTGLNVTGGTVTATDSILDAFGKVQNQINGLIGGSIYQGTWNASTNTPALASGVGTKGYYYIVSVAGTTNLDGITDWNVGDWAIYDGTAWQQVDNTDAVVSVNGFTGAVSLTTSNIAEGTNEYFTTARARQSVSTGTGISYDNSTGVITNSAPDQTVSLTASTGISTSGTYPNFTITNTAPDQVVSLTGAGTTLISGSYPNFTITSDDQFDGTVTSVAASVPTGFVVTGSPITTTGTLAISYDAGYALPTTASQSNWDSAYTNRITTATAPLSIASNTISISQATTSTNGYLSSIDWNTFNNKQNALTNPVTGTGTTNYLTKFTGTSTIGNSLFFDNGTNIGIGTSGGTYASTTLLLRATSATSTNYSFIVEDNATNQLFAIRNSGNVLLGSNANSADLSLLTIKQSSTSYNNGIYLERGGERNGYFMYIGGALDALTFRRNYFGTQSDVMSLTRDGNVGIGTTSPQARTDSYRMSGATANLGDNIVLGVGTDGGVVGTYTQIGLGYHSRNAGNYFPAIIASVVENSSNQNAEGIAFATRSATTGTTRPTERMRISSSGNIVIGRSDPGTTRLMVCGVDTSSSNYTLFAQDSTTNNLFYVRNDGLIVTGNRTNSPYNLAVAGRDVFVASDGGLGYNSSVRESKINIKNIDSVEWLLDLNPVSFNKRKKDEDGKYTDEYYEDLDYGLIAEEAELVNDKICFYDESEEGRIIRGVSYSKLTTPMLKLIQQQQAKIQELSAKVSALENKS
jgi:Chaperone of endosialidase